ncbi:hypothetical protein ABMC88_13505 [Sulfitobacter sp. HNIBRBA2951]|uniref:hypothetical protein n=1 Tax=Sulfitobacter aquimarinus TaxID=3158557 RepID=UPI0032E040C6
MTDPDSFDLEAAFEAARAAPPVMPDGLAARIVADAAAQMPRAPWWQRMMASVGGPAGVGGLVTATVVGFWVGVAPPDTSVDPLALMGIETALDDTSDDLPAFGGFVWDSEEG